MAVEQGSSSGVADLFIQPAAPNLLIDPMKRIIVILLAVGVLGALAYGWSLRSGAATETNEIETTEVTRGSIRMVVASTGRVVPNLDVQIKCKASGEITQLPYDVSDSVKKGDLLLQIDKVDEERMTRQAQAALDSSKARLEIAKTNLVIAHRDLETERLRALASLKSAEANAKDARAKAKRMQELLSRKLTSPEETETANTTAAKLEVEFELAKIRLEELKTEEQALKLKQQDVKLAESAVLSDELKLEIQDKRLRDTTVLAPISGVIATREVQTGQIISSGISNVGGGTTTMIVSDLSRIFVLASVDESDIGQVKVGQNASITADAFPGQTFDGKVVRIATQGVNLNNVVTFEVKIEVLGEKKSLLKPEMTANVAIILAQKDDVLLVPAEAVVRKAGEHFAEVLKGESKEQRKVEIGLSDLTSTEIASGLSEGDVVVVNRESADTRWSGRQSSRSSSRSSSIPFMGPSRRGLR